MATRTITTRLAIDGEAEYKAKLQNINAELRLYKSELEKVEAQYTGQLNSLEALQAREAALGGQLNALGKRYAEQSSMLEKAREAQRVSAISLIMWKIRKKRTTEDLLPASNATAGLPMRSFFFPSACMPKRPADGGVRMM